MPVDATFDLPHGIFHPRKAKLEPGGEQAPGYDTATFEDQLASVRWTKAATSSIQRVAGKPNGTRHSLRRIFIMSRCGIGFGEAMLTGPLNSSRPISHSTARQKSSSWIQDMNWFPPATGPPSPYRVSRRSARNTPPSPGAKTIAVRSATLRVAGV